MKINETFESCSYIKRVCKCVKIFFESCGLKNVVQNVGMKKLPNTERGVLFKTE